MTGKSTAQRAEALIAIAHPDFTEGLRLGARQPGYLVMLAEKQKMKNLKVRDVMTADPTTLKRNDKLTLADDIMRLGRVRHLPVLDDDNQTLVGIVTQRDLFRDALAQALGYGKHASEDARHSRR